MNGQKMPDSDGRLDEATTVAEGHQHLLIHVEGRKQKFVEHKKEVVTASHSPETKDVLREHAQTGRPPACLSSSSWKIHTYLPFSPCCSGLRCVYPASRFLLPAAGEYRVHGETIYEGKFRDGAMHGEGRLLFDTGETWAGHFWKVNIWGGNTVVSRRGIRKEEKTIRPDTPLCF